MNYLQKKMSTKMPGAAQQQCLFNSLTIIFLHHTSSARQQKKETYYSLNRLMLYLYFCRQTLCFYTSNTSYFAKTGVKNFHFTPNQKNATKSSESAQASV
jgi:hypothetical protein